MTPLLIAIIVLALAFDYINGFHDAANSIATVVSTKVLTPFQAVLWAALFNFAAFFIFRDHGVADTIAKTVDKSAITLPVIASGLIAAIIWNLLTWWFGIPSSSSHTLIGGFAGAAIAHASIDAINREPIIKTVSFIVLAPLVGMIVAFIIATWFLHAFDKSLKPKLISLGVIAAVAVLLYVQIDTKATHISGMRTDWNQTTHAAVITDLSNKSPAQRMGFQKGDSIITFNNAPLQSELALDKGLKGLDVGQTFSYSLFRKGELVSQTVPFEAAWGIEWIRVALFGHNFKWILLGIILTAMAVFTLFLSNLNVMDSQIWLKRMQLVSSAAFSIGHGGNDAQKVMGIITAALIAGKQITDFSEMPVWVPLACYVAIAAGTMSGGWKIIKTMGSRITKVTPFEGVAAETAGAITLFITENLKIPVSTTHTITGSIIGVGATKRLSAVRWGVTINLLWAWILTIPVSALMAAAVYKIFSFFM
jgi:PiT family inorganic phosphate transporter